jgi:hypothetical protein
MRYDLGDVAARAAALPQRGGDTAGGHSGGCWAVKKKADKLPVILNTPSSRFTNFVCFRHQIPTTLHHVYC